MKILVFYRPDSEYSRQVEEFLRDLQRQHDIDAKHLEVLNIDSREGMALASLYDVVEYPSILIVADDGSIIRSWSGAEFPLMNEIVSYTFAY